MEDKQGSGEVGMGNRRDDRRRGRNDRTGKARIDSIQSIQGGQNCMFICFGEVKEKNILK